MQREIAFPVPYLALEAAPGSRALLIPGLSPSRASEAPPGLLSRAPNIFLGPCESWSYYIRHSPLPTLRITGCQQLCDALTARQGNEMGRPFGLPRAVILPALRTRIRISLKLVTTRTIIRRQIKCYVWPRLHREAGIFSAARQNGGHALLVPKPRKQRLPFGNIPISGSGDGN